MKGNRMLVTAAVLVAGIRLWMQVRGKTKTPFNEWAIGWGATFLILAIMSEASEQAAGMLALTIVTGDFLVNGTSLFNDISGALSDASSGKGVFAAQPFATSSSSTATSSTVTPPATTPVPPIATAPLHTQG